jgi:transketolase
VTVEVEVSASPGPAAFTNHFLQCSINCGIMESDVVDVAVGPLAAGFVPFFHTFEAFASRRVYDQTFIFCAHSGLHVKIVGVKPGITTTHNGGTSMPLQDTGIMRNIPRAAVSKPTDSTMLKEILMQADAFKGLVYTQVSRKNIPKVYAAGSRSMFGKGILINGRIAVTRTCTRQQPDSQVRPMGVPVKRRLGYAANTPQEMGRLFRNLS